MEFSKKRRALIALPLLAGFSQVKAQAKWPSRPVKVLVGMPPGSATDVMARLVAQILSDKLGQSFYVENKPGAGGLIATGQAAHADPDGYTLLMSSSGPLAVNPSLYAKLPYDPVKDFAPITIVSSVSEFLVINPSFPPNTVQELVDYVKKQPRPVNYGSSGIGVTNHIVMEYFRHEAGLKMTNVPYKGGPAALSGVMGGQVPMMFETGPSVLPHAASGRLKVLAVSSLERSPAAPQVPTIAESGLPGFEATAWVGLVAPAGTPKDIVETIGAVLRPSLKSPEVRKKLQALGSVPVGDTPSEFAAYLKAEIEKWGKVVRLSGAKAG
jgi:tripartite-type tricarboxylate transporter receptor subunit TctC